MPRLYMETTTISDAKTVALIQELLAQRGATAIQIDYLAGRVEGVSFCIRVGDRDVPFRLPGRWQAIRKLLEASGRRPPRGDTFESWARRVAWRQVLRWVEAQLALVETGMVKTEEVFLPYALMPGQKTVYELFAEKRLALTDGSGGTP